MKSILMAIKQNSILENLNATALSLAFALSMLMLFKVLGLANVGLDLTDEGYYFNWISNPWLYQYYVSQFGYIYYPLYKLLGESIVHLRQANMLISFGLGWLLTYFLLKQSLENTSKTLLIIASGSLAMPALYILMITGHWLPTPSYNSLNFQGCLLAALGFVFSLQQTNHGRLLAGLLIGLGGWLVFMAKPSTALLLAVVTVLFYLQTIKKDWRIIVSAGLVSIGLLWLSGLIIDGSVTQFIKRYQGGLLLLSNMASVHGLSNLFKLDLFSVSSLFKFKFFIITGLIYLGFKVSHSQSTLLKIVLLLILLSLLFIALIKVIYPNVETKNLNNYHTLIISAMVFASVLFVFFNKCLHETKTNFKTIILFLVLPYIFAAGTGNNYWQTGVGASIFWILASMLILAKLQINQQILSVAVCFVVSISTLNITDSIKIPYRQAEPILKQTATFIDPHSNQLLVMPNDTAKYLNTIKGIINKTAFNAQTPVIDLTGQHPGTLYFMQAKAIGQPWTIGGYPGSIPLAINALHQASCQEIASAWLLIEKDGSRAVPEQILEHHGLTMNKQKYQTVAKFETQPLNVWNQNRKAVFTHYLVKPIDVENQTKACLTYRKSYPSPFKQL